MPATTLVPGYRQVDSFGPDEEYADEEEEISYVTLDLGVVEPTLLPSTSTYRLIKWKGLDTPTPFLQLSGSIFKGRHDMLLGTELLFTEEKNDTHPNKRCLAHVGSTEQRIRFKEVQLKEKARMPSEPKSPDLLEHVASIYADVDSEKAASQAPVSGPPEQPSSKGETDSGSSRKKKNRSRKGKERAVDVNEEDAMDTI